MKTEQEIVELRWRVLTVWHDFAQRLELPFYGTKASCKEMHFMAMGAMAFADAILDLERPPNLEEFLKSMVRSNLEAN